MSTDGAVPRAAAPVSSARAEASRKNGAKSRGPNTPEGKARSAQNALRHGMRAQKYVVLPEEDAAEFGELEAALVEELAPVGALQTVLARRVAVAAWRLARADRIEAELFEERQVARRRAWARPDPRRQRRAVVRDAAALSRRGHGRVLACPAHPQSAPGRAGGRDRCCAIGAPAPAGGAAAARPASATERTRALCRSSAGLPVERAAHARRPARARRALAARTKPRPGGMRRRCPRHKRTRKPHPSLTRP